MASDDLERRSRILDYLPEIVIVLDADAKVSFASGLMPSHIKLGASELIGRDIWELVHPEDIADAARSLDYTRGSSEGEPLGPFTVRYFDRDGNVRVAESTVVHRPDVPHIGGTIVLLRDVVGPQAVESAFECLAEGADLSVIAGHLLRAVEEGPITGIGWVLRVRAEHVVDIVAMSPGAASLVDVATLVGDWINDEDAEAPVDDPELVKVADPLRMALAGLGIQSLTAMPVRTPDSARPDLWLVTCNRWADPATANVVRTIRRYASVLSIALDRLRLQDELRHAAVHDGMTGLTNRAAFIAQLTDARQAGHVDRAVLYLDLDGFKPINDRLGHPAGDAVLVEVSRRIGATLHPDDVIARIGGDEFAVLVRPEGTEQAEAIADAIIAAAAQPIDIGDERVCIGVSVGIAVGPAHDVEALLERADNAMYAAKSAGGTWRLAEHGERRVADRRSR